MILNFINRLLTLVWYQRNYFRLLFYLLFSLLMVFNILNIEIINCVGSKFKQTPIIYETLYLRCIIINEIRIFYLPQSNFTYDMILNHLNIFNDSIKLFDFQVLKYKTLNGLRFHSNTALGHYMVESGVPQNLSDCFINLQLTHDKFFDFNNLQLYGRDFKGGNRIQYILKNLYLFEKRYIDYDIFQNREDLEFLQNNKIKLENIFVENFNKALINTN